MLVEIPDSVVEELQTLDALQSCRVPFKNLKEREEQLNESYRLSTEIGDKIMSIVMLRINEMRGNS